MNVYIQVQKCILKIVGMTLIPDEDENKKRLNDTL